MEPFSSCDSGTNSKSTSLTAVDFCRNVLLPLRKCKNQHFFTFESTLPLLSSQLSLSRLDVGFYRNKEASIYEYSATSFRNYKHIVLMTTVPLSNQVRSGAEKIVLFGSNKWNVAEALPAEDGNQEWRSTEGCTACRLRASIIGLYRNPGGFIVTSMLIKTTSHSAATVHLKWIIWKLIEKSKSGYQDNYFPSHLSEPWKDNKKLAGRRWNL